MDPYLEKHWRDVHLSLIALMRSALNDGLPADLIARADERVFIESPLGKIRSVYPDVRVVEYSGRSKEAAAAGTALLEAPDVTEAIELHLEDEPVSQGYIEIIDVASGNRVITVIELLSPANKLPGEGQDLYRRKQGECRAGGVNLVEIDLLRMGERVVLSPTHLLPPQARTTYLVSVWRALKPQKTQVYPVPLQARLPVIRIPLRESDDAVSLDLQKFLDQCYRDGRYDTLDYRAEPDPPLEGADREWADQLLRDRGRR